MAANPATSLLMTTEEAAQRLGLTVQWLRKRTGPRSKDPVPHRKIGAFVRFTEADLEAICERAKVGQ